MGTIGDIMSRPVVTIGGGESLTAAATLMGRWRVSALVVVDDGAPVGLISSSDLARYLAERPSGPASEPGRVAGPPDRGAVGASELGPAVGPSEGEVGGATTVAAWMGPTPPLLAPGTRVQQAIPLVLRSTTRHVCVIDGGRLTGVVSVGDLLAAARRLDDLDLAVAVRESFTSRRRRRSDVDDGRGLHDRLVELAGGAEVDVRAAMGSARRALARHTVQLPGDETDRIAAAWSIAARSSDGVSTVLALVPAIGWVRARADGPAIGSPRPSRGIADSVLASLGAPTAPYRVAALDEMLGVMSRAALDGPALAISAAAAAGLAVNEALPLALRVSAGAGAFGGSVRDARRGEAVAPVSAPPFDEVDAVLTVLGRAIDLGVRRPGRCPAGAAADLFDVLEIPAAYEPAVLALGSSIAWARRWQVETDRLAEIDAELAVAGAAMPASPPRVRPAGPVAPGLASQSSHRARSSGGT